MSLAQRAWRAAAGRPATATTTTTAALRLPGAEGLMVFVLLDMMFFALMFAAFTAGRVQSPALYQQSRQALNATLGMLNTFVLLTSSWALAVAVQAHAANHRRSFRWGLGGAIALGGVFIAIKAFEYQAKLRAGITMLSNEFFTWYYFMTGLHFLHVLVGVLLLLVLWWQSRSSRRPPLPAQLLESAGVYWHMVDLLWVLLFPVIYLL